MKVMSAGNSVKKILALLFALIYLLPLYIAVVNSVKSDAEILLSPISLPRQVVFDSFATAFYSSNILRLYRTSIIITVCSVAILIAFSSTAAYVIARRKGSFYSCLYVFSLAGIMVPPVVTLIPSIQTLQVLGLLHTMPGLFLFYSGTFFSTTIFLYVNFIKTIPLSLEEAAYIDGANQFTTFFRIIFPLLKPCTATAVIFLGMWVWNDFLNPMYILGTTGGMTITTGIHSSIGPYASRWNLVFANVILATLPIIILYLCLQRQFMKGLTAGAVKG